MAVSAFRMFNKAKKNILCGDLDLNAGTLRVYLCRGTGAGTYTLSTWASVYAAANRCSGGAYSHIGKTLTGVTVSFGASTKVCRFDSTQLVWTATQSNIKSIRQLIIGISNGKMLGWVELTSAGFNLGTGNTLTVVPSATGWFELTGCVT